MTHDLREPMSLLSELEARGVTAEDLQKAASARLFEKAAAAEGVNLDELGEDQVEEMYASFIHNHASSAQGDLSKEATAMNDEIVDLFEKTAAAEGINLDEMDDTELVELYNHYVENVLPEQIGDKTASAEDEAYEKLAEAEILGRHMARAYMDELEDFDKIARARWKTELGVGGGSPKGKASGKRWQAKYRQEAKDKLEAKANSAKQRKQRASRGSRLKAMGRAGRAELNAAAPSLTMKDKARSMGERSRYHLAEFAKRNPRLAKAAPYAAAAGAAGAVGYGAYRAGKGEKAASFEDDATLLALEMLKSASGEDYDDAVEARALEILDEHGLLD